MCKTKRQAVVFSDLGATFCKRGNCQAEAPLLGPRAFCAPLCAQNARGPRDESSP